MFSLVRLLNLAVVKIKTLLVFEPQKMSLTSLVGTQKPINLF